MLYFLFSLLFIAIMLEGTFTSLPLVLITLILLSISMRKSDIFLVAFLASLVLDVFLVRATGITSIFFLCILLLIFLYDKKYDVTSLSFILIITALSCGFYLFIFPSPNIFLQVIISTLLAGGLYSLLGIIFQKKVIHR